MPDNGTAMRKSSRFIDLDAALEAMEPIEIKFRGKIHVLPEDIPMDDAVRVMRAVESNNGELVEEYSALVLGQDVYAALKADRIGLRSFVSLIKEVLAMYGLAGTDEPVAAGGWGEAPDPQ